MNKSRSPPATTPDPTPGPEWSVREGDGERDARFCYRQWHHYFGADVPDEHLPFECAVLAGWDDTDDADGTDAVYGTVAVHDPPRREGSVRVGCGLASILTADRAADELPSGRFDADALVGGRAAFLWFGIVDPAWRGRGIGRAMFQRRQEWARSEGADVALAYGWERREGRSSRPLFESEGWVPVQQFSEYYGDDGRTCPDCGAWPSNDVDCRCGMTLWAVDL